MDTKIVSGVGTFPLRIPSGANFEMPNVPRINGEVNDVELMALCYLCSLLKPRVVFEIGTFRGRTTLGLAMNTSGKVFTLDITKPIPDMDKRDQDLVLPREQIGAIYREHTGHKAKIIQLLGNSRQFNFAPFHNNIDLVFIDGSHDFWSTLFDLYHAKQMVTKTGTIICHDYASWEKGVTDAVGVFWQQYHLTGLQPEETSLVCFGHDILKLWTGYSTGDN